MSLDLIPYSEWQPGQYGAVLDMPDQVYRDQPGLTQSRLSLFADSPAAFQRGDKVKQTKAMQEGHDLHLACLLGVFPVEWSTAYVKKMEAARYCLRRHNLASDLLSGGHAEVSCFAEDPISGDVFKGRMDYVRVYQDHVVVADLKKTVDASYRSFQRTLFERRYHVQAALYRRILQYLGVCDVRYWLIPIETGHHLRCDPRQLCERAIDQGEATLDKDLADIANCEQAGVWPDWPVQDGPPEIDLPEWAYEDKIELSGMTPAAVNQE